VERDLFEQLSNAPDLIMFLGQVSNHPSVISDKAAPEELGEVTFSAASRTDELPVTASLLVCVGKKIVLQTFELWTAGDKRSLQLLEGRPRRVEE